MMHDTMIPEEEVRILRSKLLVYKMWGHIKTDKWGLPPMFVPTILPVADQQNDYIPDEQQLMEEGVNGMRMLQLIGLNQRAIEFLEKNRKTIKKKCSCPHCASEHLELPVVEKINGRGEFIEADFDVFDTPSLVRYQLKDNSWVYEFNQKTIWDSGPCVFLALSKDAEGKHPIEETLWSEEEIDLAF
jgi:hypothetical protein